MFWCFYLAGPLPSPTFPLESLNVNFSESSTLDLMDACRDTLSSLRLSTHELRSLDIARITEYPPLTHLHVTVYHPDAGVQISRLLAACRTLTHLTISECTFRSIAITIGPGDLPKLEWFEGPVWHLPSLMRESTRPIHTYRQQQRIFEPLQRGDEVIEGILLLAFSANVIQELEVEIFPGDSEGFGK